MRGGFLWINNEIIDDFAAEIGGTGLLVYVILCRYANNGTAESYPSQEKLAELCQVSVRTIRRAIASLQQHKLILIDQLTEGGKFSRNIYTLLRVRRTNLASEQGAPEDITVGHTVGHHSPTNNTEQDLEQDLVLSPSEGKTPKVDSRFPPFKELIFRFCIWKWGREPMWDGAEANQLSRLLKADPKLETNTFAVWLKNYGASKDISPGERPCMFLPRISKYSVVALNQYGRDENVESKQDSLARRNANALAQVFGKLPNEDGTAIFAHTQPTGSRSLEAVSRKPFLTGD